MGDMTMAQAMVRWVWGSPAGGMLLAHGSSVNDREAVTLLLGLVALTMAMVYRRPLSAVPGIRWWMAALVLRVGAWVMAVAEAVALPELFGMMEHVLLTASTALAAVGCWKLLRPAAEGST
jgi:hypothetical protein